MSPHYAVQGVRERETWLRPGQSSTVLPEQMISINVGPTEPKFCPTHHADADVHLPASSYGTRVFLPRRFASVHDHETKLRYGYGVPALTRMYCANTTNYAVCTQYKRVFGRHAYILKMTFFLSLPPALSLFLLHLLP